MEVTDHIKASGNHYFDKKVIPKAGKKYKKALRYYDWLAKIENLPESFVESMQTMRISLLLNLSAVELKLKNYRETVKLCNIVRI